MITDARRSRDLQAALQETRLTSEHEFNRVQEQYDYCSRKRALTFATQRQDSVLRSQQVEQLEASVERMGANLEFVRGRLEDLVLKAPVSGQLTSLNAQVGEFKQFGQRLGQVDVLDGFKVQADIDEYCVSKIKAGQFALATVTAAVCSLVVSKVYPEIREGRFKVDLVFRGGAPAGLRRGQTLQIRLVMGESARALLMARGAFFNTTGGRWVYVLSDDGHQAVRREVRLGRQNIDTFEVLSGLAAGEKVITSSYEDYGQYDRLVLH